MVKVTLDKAVPDLGTHTLIGTYMGMRRVVDWAVDKLMQQRHILPEEYESLVIEEKGSEESLSLYLEEGIPETVKPGTTPRKYKCPIWKYFSITWVTNRGISPEGMRPVMGELAEEMISTGAAKDIICRSIYEQLERAIR